LHPAARTHRKYHRTPGPQVKRETEWRKLVDGSDAGTKHDLSIGYDTHDRANTVLGAAKVAAYGILAARRGSEYQVGILATNPRYEQKLIRQQVDVAVIIGGPVVILRGR
jgi:hypothetical protein